MKKILLLLLCFYFLVANGQSNAKRVLFIGNSYTFYNDMPALVKNCAFSTNDTLVTEQNTISGYTLRQHSTNATTLSKIQQGGYDHVILQANSLEFTYDDNTVNTNTIPYAKYLDSLAHIYSPCSQNILYNTWGRANGSNGQTYLQQDTLVAKRYRELAALRSAMISPVGQVRRYLRTNSPALELYVADESHPSAAGSYVSAVCFYTVIFRKDPTLITYNFNLSAADANTVKQAVKEILYNDFSKWNVGSFDLATPVADFNASIDETTISLSNSSQHANSYSWNFGDNTHSSEVTPSHTYATNGTYNVSLTASHCRLKNTITKQVTVSTVKPIITNVTQFPEYVFPNDPVKISASITDNTSITSALLYWGTSSGNLSNSISMNLDAGLYVANIPVQTGGETIYYTVLATDSENNTVSITEYSYRVQEVRLIISPSSIVINRSAQQQFTVSATDLNGNPIAFTPTWSTNGGNITSGGLLYAPYAPGVYTVTVSQPGVNGIGVAQVTVSEALVIEGKVEAESYSSMSGIQSEATGDAGGGLNIAYIDVNDWMMYDVNVLETGMYRVEFRLATTQANVQLELFTGTTSLGILTVPTSTGGWQNWQTFAMNVPLTAGLQTLKLQAKTGGFNINWINFIAENIPLGINDDDVIFDSYQSSVEIAPNPFQHSTVLQFKSAGVKRIQILSIQGNVYAEFTTNENRLELGSRLYPGVYAVKISESDRSYVFKLVKE